MNINKLSILYLFCYLNLLKILYYFNFYFYFYINIFNKIKQNIKYIKFISRLYFIIINSFLKYFLDFRIIFLIFFFILTKIYN